MKGRLRWPLGKTSSEGGYKIFEVCHARVTIYKKHTLGLKVRETNRFNERYATAEMEKGVTLILKEMNTKLQVKLFCFCIKYIGGKAYINYYTCGSAGTEH